MNNVANKSEQIRLLARQGMSKAEIAREVGVRYQFVYNVIRKSSSIVPISTIKKDRSKLISKPVLEEDALLAAGFNRAGRWIRDSGGGILIDGKVPYEPGVYAFCQDGQTQYVGVATMGLAKRLYFYRKPGISQTTSIRIRGIIDEVISNSPVHILVAMPENLSWNGLPVNGAAGLELGLIQIYSLPWNKRSAG
ncbi:MAG: hypothetical protein DI623_14695 [Sphingomonas sanxanigenens]|uniref:GIY-YIG domain-containing protein n=1 Tax=Sphingomonas sanxanigenens TaxID=397260 RepID=A0A2W5BWG1_9SPHN|nr:MAG: hypothetical protein DI623_14695 [Sphingomonas sanxanigenens]